MWWNKGLLSFSGEISNVAKTFQPERHEEKRNVEEGGEKKRDLFGRVESGDDFSTELFELLLILSRLGGNGKG